MEIDGTKSEVALARTEQKVSKGYKGFTFYTNPDITVEQDLIRRDLTINAMAINLITGELLDPYGGKQDLIAGVLRHTSEAFSEDPLRIYRIARFASRLGFRVAPETSELMLSLRDELRSLTPEKVAQELLKALTSPFPDKFFRELDGLLDVHFHEIEALKIPDRHDGTAFEHTMACLYRGHGLYERFSLLVHDLGKGLSPNPPIHNGHEEHTHRVDQLGDRLRLPKKLVDFGKRVMSTHMKLKKLDEMRPGKLFRLIKDKSIFKLLRLSYLESGGRYDKQLYRSHVDLAKKILKIQKEVTGTDLIGMGVVPDRNFGDKLLQQRISVFKRSK